MNSLGLRVFPKSTERLEGDIIFIRVTFRSIRWAGMQNSSNMHNGIAPPQGLAVLGLRSKRKVSTPPAARASAADEPAGPPPITAARSLLLMVKLVSFLWVFREVVGVWGFSASVKEWRGWIKWAGMAMFLMVF